MYMGETVEASPTPIPPTNRQMMSCVMPPAIAQPTVETANRTAETIRVHFRPKLSASQTPAKGPKGQPNKALPVTTPNQNGVKENSVLRKMTTPEISERS